MILINSSLKRFAHAGLGQPSRAEISRLALNLAINNGPEIAEIDIDGVIGEDWWVDDPKNQNTSANVREALRAITAPKIVVNINSFGGYASEGMAIHDALVETGKEVETKVYGTAASAATVIAQAGTRRLMSKNALYLIHEAWVGAIGNVRIFKQVIEDLEQVNELMLDLYTQRSGKERDVILELMSRRNGEGVWIKATEALEFGLIDAIIEPKAQASATATPVTTVSQPATPPAAPNTQAAESFALQLEILKLKTP